jgi:uncharacterized RDD family membrane protein YckC
MMEYRYGGFWRRAAAILIDKIILYCVYLVLIFVEFAILPSRPYSHLPDTPEGIWADMTSGFIIGHLIMGVLIGMVYFITFHGSVGRTPGKMLLGLKVIQTSGKDMTYGIAFLRWVGYIFSVLPLYIGFLWVAFDAKKQGWHDKIAGTLVIRAGRDEHQNGPIQTAMNI